MIGWINPESKSFGGLISYIESGKGGRHPGRVAWMEFYNLPTRKPRVAACYMAATGRSSISCTRTPVYHFSVSFAPDDPVDEAMMRRVAERTLRDMGLEEYECAVFAHRDRSHVHLHFVVCRVHPVRRTLWRNWRDRTRLEYSLRAQEVEFGLQVVPGWLAPVPVVVDRARDGLAQDQQPEARWLKPRPAPSRGDAVFLRDVTERAAPVLAQARSWAELERGLAEQGLSLRVKGGGFRITDGEHQVKASEVGRDFSRYHLENRLGGYPDYRARMAVAGIAPVRPASLVQPEASAQQQEQPSPPSPPPSATPASPGRSGSDDALLVDAAAAPTSAAPELRPESAPQPSVHSSPAETRGPDARPVQLPKPTKSRQLVDFLLKVKERGVPVLERAESWEALERGLADRGLSLRVKGGGFTVTDGELEVKASDVGRAFSRPHLEDRLGPYPRYRVLTASTKPTPTATVPQSVRQQEKPTPAPVQSPPPVLEPAAPIQQPAQPAAPPAPVVPPAETPKPTESRQLVDFLLKVKERGVPVLERAESWEALERGLAGRGLSLRVKGGGFTVTDGELEVKASDVGRAFSRPHLEDRLGPYPRSTAGKAARTTAPAPPAPEPVLPKPVRTPGEPLPREVLPAPPERRLEPSGATPEPRPVPIEHPIESTGAAQPDQERDVTSPPLPAAVEPAPCAVADGPVERFFGMAEQVRRREALMGELPELREAQARLAKWSSVIRDATKEVRDATQGFTAAIRASFRDPHAFQEAFKTLSAEQRRAALRSLRERPADFAREFATGYGRDFGRAGELASDRRPAFQDAGERLFGDLGRRVSAKIGEHIFGRGEEMRQSGTLVADAGKRYLDAVVARIIARQDLARQLGLPLSATLEEVEDACSTQLAAANAREAKVLDRAKSLPGDWSLEKAFRGLSPEDRGRVLQRMPELVQLIPKALRIARDLAEGPGVELD